MESFFHVKLIRNFNHNMVRVSQRRYQLYKVAYRSSRISPDVWIPFVSLGKYVTFRIITLDTGYSLFNVQQVGLDVLCGLGSYFLNLLKVLEKCFGCRILLLWASRAWRFLGHGVGLLEVKFVLLPDWSAGYQRVVGLLFSCYSYLFRRMVCLAWYYRYACSAPADLSFDKSVTTEFLLMYCSQFWNHESVYNN